MVPQLTRRRLLAAGGLTASALTGGYALADRVDTPSDSLSGWPMVRHGPAGRGYTASARPPTDGVTVAWRRPFDGRIGYGYGDSPVVADGRVVATFLARTDDQQPPGRTATPTAATAD